MALRPHDDRQVPLQGPAKAKAKAGGLHRGLRHLRRRGGSNALPRGDGPPLRHVRGRVPVVALRPHDDRQVPMQNGKRRGSGPGATISTAITTANTNAIAIATAGATISAATAGANATAIATAITTAGANAGSAALRASASAGAKHPIADASGALPHPRLGVQPGPHVDHPGGLGGFVSPQKQPGLPAE